MRTEAQVQADLTRCYNAIAELNAGNVVSKFTFASAESQQSYEKAFPTLTELETHRDNLLQELTDITNSTATSILKFTKSYFQTVYSKFD